MASAAERRRSRDIGRPRLYERDRILGEFEAIFSRTLPVPSRCIVIEGPWGSGRTALVNAACGAAARGGAHVLRARGGEIEKRNAYGILSRFVESAGTHLSGAESTPGQQETLRAVEEALAADDQSAHDVRSLFYSLVVALREQAPVLLAVDDADLADRETLAVLQYVAHRVENRQIWVLVSTRPLHPGVGLRPVDWLLSEPGTRLFRLEPLGADSVRALLHEHLGHRPDPALVDACCEATGGKPFFLNAMLPSLRDGTSQSVDDLVDGLERNPAPRITQLVLGRLALLPVAAADVLQAGAILGDGADSTVARELAKVDPLAAERALDAAAQMELLLPGRPIVFSSPLIRWAIDHDIPTARRSQLHARAARLLRERNAPDEEIAVHLLATEPAGSEEVVEWLRELGRSLLTTGHPDTALRCLQRALLEPPAPAQRSGVHLDLAAAEAARRSPAALSHFRRALQGDLHDDAAVVRVAVTLLRNLGDAPEAQTETIPLVRSVADRTEGVDRDLQLEFELGLAMASPHPAQRSRGLRRLEELLTTPGDDRRPVPQMARTFVTIQRVMESSGISVAEVTAALEPVVDQQRLLSTDPLVHRLQVLACYGLLCADRFAQLDQLFAGAAERARAEGLLQAELDISFLSTISLLWQGSITEAENEARRARALGTRLEGRQWNLPTISLVDALVRQGRLADARQYADVLFCDEFDDPMFRSVAHLEQGRLLVARGLAREGLAEFLVAGDQLVGAGIINPAFNAWRAEAATALASLGEWERAEGLAEEHLALARSFGAPRTIGVGLRALAAATPDLGLRIERLTEAVDLLEPSQARLEAAFALVELGTALVEAKEKEDARSVLRRGVNLASLCGAHQLVEMAGTQLRAAGARPRRLGTTGPDSLTPAELRVVRLAAEGHTNQGIADSLYVTIKTVEGHLAKAFRKLAVESRTELASALSNAEPEDGPTEVASRAV